MSECYSFLIGNNIQLYGHSSLSLHLYLQVGLFPLSDYCNCNVCWFTNLFESLFSILLSVYLGVELLAHVIILCLAFEELPNFPQWLYLFAFPAVLYKGFNFSMSLSTLVISVCFLKIIAILVGVVVLIVVLIFVPY